MLILVRWITQYWALVFEDGFAPASDEDSFVLNRCAESLSAESSLSSVGRLRLSVMSSMTPVDHKMPLRSVQILSVSFSAMLPFIVLGTVVGLTIFLRATSDLESEA